jgi:hypothetical protein
MARKAQNPNVGKYMAMYSHHELDDDSNAVYDTPEEALDQMGLTGYDDGDVIYVYAIVGVKVVRKPTLTENYIP